MVSWPADSPCTASDISSQTWGSPTSIWIESVRSSGCSGEPRVVTSTPTWSPREAGRSTVTHSDICLRMFSIVSSISIVPGSTSGSGRSKRSMSRSSICGRVSTVAVKVSGAPGDEVRDLVDLGGEEGLDGALRLRLPPVAGEQPLLDLLVDVLGEPAADQLGGHLALAEAGQAHLLAVIVDHALGLRLDGGRGNLDLQLFAAGPDILDGKHDAHQ